MTTYNVTNSNDSGAGSLREAIALANNNAGKDSIIIDIENITLNGEIEITDSVEITGTKTVIAQEAAERLFYIDNGNDDSLIDIQFNNLTLTGGNSATEGGAIYSSENLILDQVMIENNTAVGFGGGIFQTLGDISINDSQFSNNETLNDVEGNSEGGALTAINLFGNVKIENSLFKENVAELGAILIENAEVEINHTKVIDNDSRGIIIFGSITNIDNILVSNNNQNGIVLGGAGTTVIENSTISQNKARFGAGIGFEESTVTINNSIIENNIATEAGGGISLGLSDLTITNSIISNNSAPIGSGIETYDFGTAKIVDTYINNNTDGQELEGEGFTFEGANTTMPFGEELTETVGYQEPPVEEPPVEEPPTEEPPTEEPPTEEINLELTEVNRFYQYEKGFHFYTSSEVESLSIQERSSTQELKYNYEGESFTALSSDLDSLTGNVIEGAEKVYRFFNSDTGAHLFTMDSNEKDYILENLDNYTLEGTAFYAFEEAHESIETISVYRMLNSQTGTHLLTSDSNEFATIQETLPHFSVEGNDGIAFHVLEL